LSGAQVLREPGRGAFWLAAQMLGGTAVCAESWGSAAGVELPGGSDAEPELRGGDGKVRTGRTSGGRAALIRDKTWCGVGAGGLGRPGQGHWEPSLRMPLGLQAFLNHVASDLRKDP
jgi:hypothetical protein